MKKLLLGFVLLSGFAFAQTPQIDIINATLFGEPLCGMPLDHLTDLLGRPSVVIDNALIAEVIGPRLFYHQLGLSFWHNTKLKDPNEGVSSTAIYIAKVWDEENLEWFQSYGGSLTQNVNADLKLANVVEGFSEYAPTIRTAEQATEDAKAIYKDATPLTTDFVDFEFNGYDVHFIHEGVTKFLERITITCGPI